MKKPIDFLILLAPALLWLLSSLLLGDDFALPNRLMLAILCTAAGAGALVTNRKIPGFFALVAGVGMLAAVPVEHDMPGYLLTNAKSAQTKALPCLDDYSDEAIQLTAQDIGNVGIALMDSGLTNASMNTALIVSASEAVGRIQAGILSGNGDLEDVSPSKTPMNQQKRDFFPTNHERNPDERPDSNS